MAGRLAVLRRARAPPGYRRDRRDFASPPERAAALLRDLQQRDLVGLDPTSGTVTYAYPLAPDATGHQVWLGGRVLNALCAIDALGIAEMFDADATVTARCRSCGDTVTVSTAERGACSGASLRRCRSSGTISRTPAARPRPVARTSRSSARTSISGTGSTASDPRVGARLTMPEALELGRAIFGPVMRAPERPDHDQPLPREETIDGVP